MGSPPLAALWRFTVALALCAIPCTVRSGSGVGSAAPPIVLSSSGFSLTINGADCTASLAVATSLARGPAAARTAARSAPVPFVSLYNRISDGRDVDFAPCAGVALVPAATTAMAGVLRVTAAHGAGTLELSYTATPTHLEFGVRSTASWAVPAAQRHLSFGLWWEGTGVLDNRTTHPLVMGKLMGPWGVSASVRSAAFLSRRPCPPPRSLSRRGPYINTRLHR